MLNEHALRRRPIIRNSGDDRRGAGLRGMARERSRDFGAGFADIDNHRNPTFDLLDGEFGQSFAFADRKAYRFARVHRQRQPLGAAMQMKVEHFAVADEIDPAVCKGSDGSMHQGKFESSHGVILSLRVIRIGLRYQPCGSLCRMPSALSCCSMNLMRSGDAVGSGGLVGPTGRPMMTQPPLSEEGYWSRNMSQSCDSLYCSSRARAHLPVAQQS